MIIASASQKQWGGMMNKQRLRIGRALILTTTILTGLGAMPAFAQDSEEQDPITVVGRRPSYTEEETSTATRTASRA